MDDLEVISELEYLREENKKLKSQLNHKNWVITYLKEKIRFRDELLEIFNVSMKKTSKILKIDD